MARGKGNSMKKTASAFSSLNLFRKCGVGAVIFFSLAKAGAVPLDDVSPPPPTDPSAYNNPPADPQAAMDALEAMPEANHGSLALPNGAYGDRATPLVDNVLPPSVQTSYNFPTNGKPCLLYTSPSPRDS